MTSFAVLIPLVVAAALSVWYGVRLFQIIKTDGYAFRAASGLPRDWSPTPDLPSTPYVKKPHF
jgi:hypothetical protein